jgi:hypothetical protein
MSHAYHVEEEHPDDCLPALVFPFVRAGVAYWRWSLSIVWVL